MQGNSEGSENRDLDRRVRSRGKTKPSHRIAGLGLVAVILALASCSSGSRDSMVASQDAMGTSAGAPGNVRTLGAPAAGGQGAGAGPQNAEVSFKVNALDQTPKPQVGSFISTANLTVKVKSVAEAKPRVVSAAQSLGGGLFGEQTTMGEQSKSVITLKVAPEKFADLIAELSKLGTLASEEVKTDDVTQQVIDLDARIKASESSLVRTRALLDQAKSLVEISQLENEVARRQSDVENLRGQKVSLDTKINLSTVVVTLIGENDATPAVVKKQQDDEKPAQLPGFMDGLNGGLKVGSNVGNVLLAGLGAFLPFAPVLALVGFGLRFMWRSQRRRLTPKATATPY